MTARSHAGTLAGALLAVLLLAGCSGAEDTTPAAQPTSASPTNPAAPEETTAPEDEQPTDADGTEVTCETLVSATVAENFAEVGWSSQAEPFRVGGTEIEGGLLCTWADFESDTGGDLQFFGWAPIDAGQALEVQQDLLAQGWSREQGPNGVYITESAATIIAPDDDGYGVTYLFGDGWVEYADTKQSLLLITSPRG